MEPKVLYVVGQLGIGGSERQLMLTVEYMKSQGITPAVAVWSYRAGDLYFERLKHLGVSVHSLGSGVGGKIVAIRKLVREFQPGLVHSFSFFLNAAVWLACARLPCIVVGSARAELAKELKYLGVQRAILNASVPRVQVFNSRAAIKQAPKVLPVPFPPKRLHVPNGLDLSHFSPTPIPSRETPIILGVGSLIPVKRWDRLILASDLLRQQSVAFRTRILGTGSLQEELASLIRSRQLDDVVELAGATSNVVSELRRSTIVAHVSESEGCPNAVLEAMACARPVVAFPAGETAYIVAHGKTGLLVDEETPAALAVALRTLLTDLPCCEAMGRAGRAQVEMRHSREASGQAMLEVYQSAGWKWA